MQKDDVARIAAGLSEEARSALAQFDTSQVHGFLMPEPGDEPVIEELMKACCISYILAGGYEFVDRTSLGLAVRSYLMENLDAQ